MASLSIDQNATDNEVVDTEVEGLLAEATNIINNPDDYLVKVDFTPADVAVAA